MNMIEAELSLQDKTIHESKQKEAAKEEKFNKEVQEYEKSLQSMRIDVVNLKKENTQLQVKVIITNKGRKEFVLLSMGYTGHSEFYLASGGTSLS